MIEADQWLPGEWRRIEGQVGGVTNTKGHKETLRDDGHDHYPMW